MSAAATTNGDDEEQGNGRSGSVMDKATSIALGFDELVVTSENLSKDLLKGISGYVQAGGVTAVMGASASGKSLLLQTLSGRVQDMYIGGKVYMDGHVVDPRNVENPIAFVPQADSVIGDLTAREVTTETALFKRNEDRAKIDHDVDELLGRLGLSHAADTIIGTLIFRGLSGGQKKRVEIANELIASPAILLLDEPTSGLDSSIAYEVVHTIRDLAKSSKGALAVIITIHQPNSRILSLFDHLLLLEQGSSVFFGTLPDATNYFTRLGYQCPKSVTPTDYYLQITDTNFTSPSDTTTTSFDFTTTWKESYELQNIRDILLKHEELCRDNKIIKRVHSNVAMSGPVPFWRQVYVLVYRDYTIAYRDPTLYYFQAMLLIGFSFMTGAVFWNLPKEVNGNFNIFPSSLLWFVFFFTWIHAFKVFHLSSSDKRAQHEIYNGKYSPLAIIISDIISVSTLTACFIPVPPIAYFMMGYPGKAFPFIILACWFIGIAGEAMIALITKFSTNPTASMVYSQIALVSLQVFGGGVFLTWRDCPNYWVWLQEMTIFAQASRTLNMEVFRYIDLECTLSGDGKCYDPSTGAHYSCDSFSSNNTHCLVNGREILAVTQSISRDMDYWYYFGYLCAIYIGLKIGIVLLTYYPFYRIQYWAMKTIFPSSSSASSSSKGTKNEYSGVGTNGAGNGNSGGNGGGDVENSQSISAASPATVIPTQRNVSKESSFHEASSSRGLAWFNYSVILAKTGAKLVDNVSGFVASGRILALMGPSGAGKTTLLNGLSGRAPYATLHGEVKFAGRPMTSQDLTYIPQFDEVNDVLTVYEHIHLIGMLTCVNKVEMLQRADELLEVLGLTKKRNTQVRYLSGGEIKRLSVGIGLISNPYVLFLDEPTTGLDSTAAYSLVKYLSIVAKATNVAVIMTLHQPSGLVFDMLDDLFLLESGKIVYAGTIRNATDYFTSIGYNNPNSINPADYFLDLALHPPSNGDQWNDLFRNSPYAIQYNEKVQRFTHYDKAIPLPVDPPIYRRFITMLTHFLRYLIIEPGYIQMRLIALIILGIFEGTLFLKLQPHTNNINLYVGAMFTAALSVMLTAISSTGLYARDRREAVDRVKNGFYSPGLYVLTQFMASSFYNWFLAFTFTCIFHWLTNINPNKISFIYDIFISWGHIMLMESALMIFIEILKNDFLSTTCGMIFLGMNMLFAGYFRQVSDIPKSISWLCFVVPFRWSIDGFTWQIYNTQSFKISGSDPEMHIDGNILLEQVFHKYDVHSWGMFGTLIGYVFFFRFIQYLLFAYQTGVLKLTNKDDSASPAPHPAAAPPAGSYQVVAKSEVEMK